MTVQGIKGNEQQNNWVVPTVTGGVIGGGVGATMLAPAKYKSFDDLVAAATSNDTFEMPKAPDNADENVKKAFKDVEDGINNVKETNKKLGELFTDGVTEVEATKVVEKLGKENVADIAQAKQAGQVAEVVSKMTEKQDLKITDELKNLFPIKEGDNAAEGAIKTADEQTKAIYKAVMGADMPEGVTVADGVFKQGDGQTVKVAKTTIENATEAAKKFEAQKPVIEFIEGANAGKVTREAAENFAKNANAPATEAFENISKQLGKNRLKGGLIWAAVGLAAGWLVSKFMGNKAEKSA